MDWLKVFANISLFLTQKAHDQDRTCYLGHTCKYFLGDLFIVIRDACDPSRITIIMAELIEHVYAINVFHDV